MRDKDGVRVLSGRLNGRRVVVKHFSDPRQAREIANYVLLQQFDVPTLEVVAAGTDWLALENMDDASSSWRMASSADLAEPHIVTQLGAWYSRLHRAGLAAGADQLPTYDELDLLSRESLEQVARRYPHLAVGLAAAAARLPEWLRADRQWPRTVTHNDFAWTNLAIARDGRSVVMFDFNLMGRGTRAADLRNVASGLPPESRAPFRAAYESASGEVPEEEFNSDARLVHLVSLVIAERRGFAQLPRWAAESAEWVGALGQ